MEYNCEYCGKSFKSRAACMYHKNHGCITFSKKKTNIRCPESECGASNFSNLESLRTHLSIIHNKLNACKPLMFPSFADFEKWKEETEEQNRCFYARSRRVKKKNGDEYVYYSCHRSGTYKPRGQKQRAMKSQNTAKIGTSCPSEIIVHLKDCAVNIKYFESHCGHSTDIRHLRLTNNVRTMIASKCKAGLSPQQIINDIRDNIGEGELHRIHLINGRDIRNIKRDFNITTDNAQKNSKYNEVKESENKSPIQKDESLLYYNDPELYNVYENCDMQAFPLTVCDANIAVHQDSQIMFENCILNEVKIQNGNILPTSEKNKEFIVEKANIFIDLYQKCQCTMEENEYMCNTLNNLIVICDDKLQRLISDPNSSTKNNEIKSNLSNVIYPV